MKKGINPAKNNVPPCTMNRSSSLKYACLLINKKLRLAKLPKF